MVCFLVPLIANAMRDHFTKQAETAATAAASARLHAPEENVSDYNWSNCPMVDLLDYKGYAGSRKKVVGDDWVRFLIRCGKVASALGALRSPWGRGAGWYRNRASDVVRKFRRGKEEARQMKDALDAMAARIEDTRPDMAARDVDKPLNNGAD